MPGRMFVESVVGLPWCAQTADIIALASRYGGYGYRRIAAMLRDAGWAVNVKRAERIWRREG